MYYVFINFCIQIFLDEEGHFGTSMTGTGIKMKMTVDFYKIFISIFKFNTKPSFRITDNI